MAEVLDEVGAADRSDDAEVLVSELATNAVVHTKASFKVGVCVDGRVVRLTVTDRSEVIPTKRSPASQEGGGRGLALVDAIADHWGIHKMPEGKFIWVELDHGG